MLSATGRISLSVRGFSPTPVDLAIGIQFIFILHVHYVTLTKSLIVCGACYVCSTPIHSEHFPKHSTVNENKPNKRGFRYPIQCWNYQLWQILFPYQAFFNSDALNLIRTLITGGATPELEQILAEGCGLVQGNPSLDPSVQTIRNRTRVALLPLEEEPLTCFCVRIYSFISRRQDLSEKSTNFKWSNSWLSTVTLSSVVCINHYSTEHDKW